MKEEEAKKELDKYQEKFEDEEDVKATIEQDGETAKHKGLRGALKQSWTDICDVVDMLYDVTTRAYPGKVPFMTLTALAGAIAYIACPIDVIPDFVPLLGYVDDAAVFGLALKLAQKDLSAYRAWRATQGKKQ